MSGLISKGTIQLVGLSPVRTLRQLKPLIEVMSKRGCNNLLLFISYLVFYRNTVNVNKINFGNERIMIKYKECKIRKSWKNVYNSLKKVN